MVVAYGRIIPSRLLELPVLGSINVHASLLPELRGAAPVAWAIARGHSLSGVSVMRMVEEMDAGPILSVESTPIQERESASELSGRLSVLGAETLVSTVRELEEGRAEEAPQDHDRATFAPRITRRTARIRWEAAAADVARLVRAMDEKPGAWSELRGRPVKLFAPRLGDPSSCERNAPSSREGAPSRSHGRAPVPGTVLAANRREGVVVACGEGSVALREVQPAGKRRMPAGAWLAGRGVSEGDLLV